MRHTRIKDLNSVKQLLSIRAADMHCTLPKHGGGVSAKRLATIVQAPRARAWEQNKITVSEAKKLCEMSMRSKAKDDSIRKQNLEIETHQ
jgi:hypothetical protein